MFQPIRDEVLIEPLKRKFADNEVILTDIHRKDHDVNTGTIMAVGKDQKLLKVGDTIVYNATYNNWIKDGNREFILHKFENIEAVIV